MITHMTQKIVELVFKLWLTITETSQVRLSTNFYFINSSLNQLLERYNLNLLSYSQNQQRHQSKIQQNNQAKSQLEALRKKNIIKVSIINNRAFWVKNNKFWTSNIIDGYIDNAHAEEIDAYSLSNKEFYMLLEILDELNS